MACSPQTKDRLGTAFHWPASKQGFLNRSHADCVRAWEAIRRAHTAGVYCDIAYNYGACVHGQVLEGRGKDKRSGANGSRSANTWYGSVCVLIGIGEQPTPEQLAAAERAAVMLGGTERQPHSKFRPTQCPGPAVNAWLEGGTEPPPPPAPKPPARPKLYGRPLGTVWWDRLRYGQRDSDSVRNLQTRLISLGYSIPAGATGNYLRQTKAAVAAFQRDQGWRGTGADGLIWPQGRMTTRRLFLYAGSPYSVRWGNSG